MPNIPTTQNPFDVQFVRQDTDGSVYIKDLSQQEFLLNPKVLSTKTETIKNQDSTKPSSKFKLVTVRQLSNVDIPTVSARLLQTQKNLENAALASGQPVPFPAKLPAHLEDNINYFSVYVDEDLYGINNPIYTFYSPSSNIKAFITANGNSKDDWSVHIAHTITSTPTPDGSNTVTWRILTIDKEGIDGSSNAQYVLESSSLPSAFQYNFTVDSLQYLGGGTWSAIVMDRNDQIPVFGVIQGTESRYKRISDATVIFEGATYNKTITSHSCTPTYQITWNRGTLKINSRTRTASSLFNPDKFNTDGVIEINKSCNYSLPRTFRVHKGSVNEYSLNEYLSSTSTYVANTNIFIASPFQSPDYNTDYARLALQQYSQTSNIIRSTPQTTNINKASLCTTGNIPILVASKDMSTFVYLDPGVYTGEITQPYDLKSSIGHRGVTYFFQYKYWWGYGKVINTYPLTPLQRVTFKIGNFSSPGDYFVDSVPGVGRYGELLIDSIPNRVITTWDAFVNPETGFFGVHEGEFQFVVQYNNPPLFGHSAVYYYEINPQDISGVPENNNNRIFDQSLQSTATFGLAPSFTNFGDQNLTQNTYIDVYSQILGAFADAAVPSLNIGAVSIGSELENRVVRSPTTEQKMELNFEPTLFPNGFWDADTISIEIDNANKQKITTYSNGIITGEYEI